MDYTPGRNLLIASRIVDGYLNANGTGITSMNSTNRECTSDWIPIEGFDKITIHTTVPSIPSNGSTWIGYAFYTDTALSTVIDSRHAKYGSTGAADVSFEGVSIPSNAKYLRVSYRRYTDGYCKVEYGSTATDWSPAPEDEVGTKTISGDMVSFSDGADNLPVTAMTVDIEPVQDLHGYDKPWAGGEWNLVDFAQVVNGIVDTPIVSLTAGTYYCYVLSDNDASSYNSFIYDENGTEIGLDRTDAYVNTRMAYNVKRCMLTVVNPLRVKIRIQGNTNVNGHKIYVTITKDGSAYDSAVNIPQIANLSTYWKPYNNICPVTGYDTVSIVRTGKNLLKFDNETNQNRSSFSYTLETPERISATKVAAGGAFFAQYRAFVKTGFTYTVSLGEYTVGGVAQNTINIYIYSDRLWGNRIDFLGVSKNGTQWTSTYTGFVVIGTYVNFSENTTFEFDNLQIELGNNATDYESYKGDTYSIALGDAVYGGSLNPKTGVLTVDRILGRKKISEYTSKRSVGDGISHYHFDNFFASAVKGGTATNVPYKISNLTTYGYNQLAQPHFYTTNNGSSVNLYLPEAVDEDTYFEAVVSLATPQTVQLTPTEVRTLLGDNVIFSDAGAVSVTYQTDSMWEYLILGRNSITCSWQIDVKSITWYYLLQSSTLSPPAKPTTYDPTGLWSRTEPAYTEGSTNSLYIVERTVYSDDSFEYSDVSMSSSYEAAKQAYNKAINAQRVVEEYVNPIASKSWTGINAVANNDPNGWLYWGFVKPTDYYLPWRITYRIKAKINGISDGYQISTVTIDGQKSTYYAYQTHNVIPNTSYRPLYAHVLYTCTQAGITANYRHLLGTRLHSSYDPVATAHARAVDIDILEATNCTFEFADTWFLYANAPGTGTTNYVSRYALDGTTNGFTESGDRNETNHLLNNFCGKTGTLGICQTCLFMEDGNGTYQSICTDANGAITRTTANTKKPNPNGFKVGSEIYFPRDGSHTTANTNITTPVWTAYGALDSRYSLNTTLTANCLTPYQPVYLVGEILGDGLFYLDNPWWTQTPNDPSKVYVHVGACYDSTTSNCRITLTMPNKWYKFVDGKLVDYSNRLAELAQSTADSKAKVFYSNSMPTGSDFNTNDVWFDTDAGNRMYYWNGSAWAEKKFSTGALADSSITAALIAADAVTADKILARTITATKIAAGAITANEIASNTITANEIASNTITANEIASNTITANEITTSNLVGTNGWINLNSGTFNYGSGKLSWDGTTMSVTGEVNATSGKFGGTNGFTIGTGKIYSGTHSAYNTAVAGVYIGTDYISLGSGGVTYLKNDGTGKLGAWQFDATKLYNGTYGSDGSVYLSTANMSSKAIGGRTGADWRVTVGSKFGVTNTGAVYCSSLTATNVDLTGKITASDGSIGGFSIGSTAISNGTYGSDSSIFISTANMASKAIGGRTGADWRLTVGSKFGVTNTGAIYCSSLTATNVDLTGKVTASDGAIGGFTIGSTSISSGTYGSDSSVFLSTANMASKAIGGRTGADWRFTVGSKFGVTNTGAIYCSSLTATNVDLTGKVTASSGKIGDWIVVHGDENRGTTAQGGHIYNTSLYSHASNSDYEYEVGLKNDGGAGTLAMYVKRIPNGAAWNASNVTDIYYLRTDGKLYASNAEIAGNITASSGKIGDWIVVKDDVNRGTSAQGGHIYNSSLYSHASNSDYEYEVGLKNDGGVGTFAMYVKRIANGAAWTAANVTDIFYLRTDGKLYAANAELKGSITAGSGKIWLNANGVACGTQAEFNVIEATTSIGTKSISVDAGSYSSFATDGSIESVSSSQGSSIILGGRAWIGKRLIIGSDYAYHYIDIHTASTNYTAYISFDGVKLFSSNELNEVSMSGDISVTGMVTFDRNYRMTNSKFIYMQLANSDTLIPTLGISGSNNLWVGPTSTANLPARIIFGDTIDKIYVFNSSGGTTLLSTAVSDRRLKHDISDLTSSHEFIMGLNAKKFKLNGESRDRYHFGFVAQDVRPLLDSTVGDGVLLEYNPNDVDTEFYDKNDDGTFTYSMDYTQFIAPHIEVTQEHDRRIEKLENEIAELKAIINQIRG